MATIATHNGTSVSRQHNIRNPKIIEKEDHIDPKGHYEVWVDETPQKAYQRLFGEAVKKYNAKQKRSDRKIDNYYKKICQDKKKYPVYEMIVGVYDKSVSTETKKEILKDFVDGWKERNPNLELIGAYFHADEEGEPHLHIDYIPVARNCKRGMETQTALVKALEQQGIVPGETMKETSQILWEAKENQHLESLCNSRGIKVEHPLKGKKDVRHMETELFKVTKKKESVENEIVIKQSELDEISKRLEEAVKNIEIVDEVDSIQKKDVFSLIHSFIDMCGIQNKDFTKSVHQIIDTCEQWYREQIQKTKWNPEKEKNDTVVKEKRKGFDDIDIET